MKLDKLNCYMSIGSTAKALSIISCRGESSVFFVRKLLPSDTFGDPDMDTEVCNIKPQDTRWF